MENPTKASLRRQSVAIATTRATWLELGAIVILICATTVSSSVCSLFWGREYQESAQQWREAEHKSAMVLPTDT
jgi:hypothetical protein